MVKAIRFDKPGGPDVMKWVDVEVGEPGAGEIRLRQHVVGLNYIDVYFRTGRYPLPLPAGLVLDSTALVGLGGYTLSREVTIRYQGLIVSRDIPGEQGDGPGVPP